MSKLTVIFFSGNRVRTRRLSHVNHEQELIAKHRMHTVIHKELDNIAEIVQIIERIEDEVRRQIGDIKHAYGQISDYKQDIHGQNSNGELQISLLAPSFSRKQCPLPMYDMYQIKRAHGHESKGQNGRNDHINVIVHFYKGLVVSTSVRFTLKLALVVTVCLVDQIYVD